jgi:long-chain fatty acid transport protein
MPNHTYFSGNNMLPRFYPCVLSALFTVFLFVPPAWGGGVWLYEGGTPDLGTAGAGRAALAADASTAGANPAGMTRLDRSQMLAAVQGLYVNSKFDTGLSGFGGGDGGNAGGFVPSGGLHYVHRVTDDFRLGISAGSYFNLGLMLAPETFYCEVSREVSGGGPAP